MTTRYLIEDLTAIVVPPSSETPSLSFKELKFDIKSGLEPESRNLAHVNLTISRHDVLFNGKLVFLFQFLM